ncbi:MAG: VOC family protein [Janthinobacterium lividum]
MGDLEIGLDPDASPPGTTGPVAYRTTEDIHGRVAALVAAGATLQQPPGDGNLLGLREA